MKKKELRKSPNINIEHFLRSYYCMEDEELISKLSKLSHKLLKQVALNYNAVLLSISFQEVTRDMLARGDVILVEDGLGHIAPYINPLLELDDEYEEPQSKQFSLRRK